MRDCRIQWEKLPIWAKKLLLHTHLRENPDFWKRLAGILICSLVPTDNKNKDQPIKKILSCLRIFTFSLSVHTVSSPLLIITDFTKSRALWQIPGLVKAFMSSCGLRETYVESSSLLVRLYRVSTLQL